MQHKSVESESRNVGHVQNGSRSVIRFLVLGWSRSLGSTKRSMNSAGENSGRSINQIFVITFSTRRLSIIRKGEQKRTFHFAQLCCRVARGILKQTLNCLGTKGGDGECSPNFRNLWVASNNLISFGVAFISIPLRGNVSVFNLIKDEARE